jgi:hypothetical protein
MNKAEKKLVKHLKKMISGIESGEIQVQTVSGTVGDPIRISERLFVCPKIISFEFYHKPKIDVT